MRREELLRAEAEGWERLNGLLDRLPEDRFVEPTVNQGAWAPRDVAWHVAYWCKDTARVLEEIQRGVFDPAAEPQDAALVDAINERELERSRMIDPEVVRAEMRSARSLMLERFGALASLTSEAAEWFEESGPLHYAEHLPELEDWSRARD